MKDETKLKDMTNFLENVYKDIKEQPTIEEEQKQEKEFINKIKGNNTNEIKEIIDLDIDRDDKLVFIDYTDNLGNKHEYEDINAEQLLDYITNLQEENNELKQIIDIRECQLEEMQMNKTDYTQVNILEMQLEDLQQENERLKDLYRRTIEHLFKIGNDELARYFQAQINDCPSFVPQDIRGDE